MGQIEKILTAMDPLLSANPRTVIRYYVKDDMAVFWPARTGCEFLSILICYSMNEGPRFYYILYPDFSFAYPDLPNSFIKNSEEILKRKERVVFSGKNVLKYLQLGELFEKSPDGPLADLHALCIGLQKKNGKVIKAFSREKIQETYNAHISMEGNDEEEINQIIKDIISTT